MEENEKTKKKKTQGYILLAGTLIIAVIFITSIAALGNGGNSNTQSTTTVPPRAATYLGIGYANATVAGYGNKFIITLINATPDLNASVSNVLNELSLNGSVLALIPSGNSYTVYQGNMSAYGVMQLLYSGVGANALALNATLQMSLPASVTLYINSNPVMVDLPANRTYSLQANSLYGVGTNIPVKLQASVYQNSSLYGTYAVYANEMALYPR